MSSEKPLSRTQIIPSKLRLTPHTAYYSSFFLLRTPITVNGQPAQLEWSSRGELTLCCCYPNCNLSPNLSLPLNSIRASLQEVVKNHGVSRVEDVCCEQVPLFPVSFTSEYNLRKFLLHKETIQQQLGSLFPTLPTQVKLQLFLVSPDAVVKDARVMEVTLENHSACMGVFKESELFDYWSLFRPYRTGLNKTPSQAAVTIKDLINELHDVISWFQLGIYLDISPSELMKIRADHREKTDDCKTEMLVTWLRQTTDASWSTVVRALVGIRMGVLAQKVAVKYGVAVPSAVERKDQELQQFSVVKEKVSSLQSELLDRALQLRYKVEADEQQLCEVTNLLAQATQLSVSASNKRILTKHQATSAHVRVKMLLEKKSEVERQLKLKQSELKFLQQLQGHLWGSENGGRDRKGGDLGEVLIEKDKEVEWLQEQLRKAEKELSFLQQLQGQLRESEDGKREREELREVLMHKDVEVRQLQEQLKEVEKELKCAREEAHSLREELQRVTVELAEKLARVQELVRTRDKLEESVNWQRKLVEMSLIQSTAAASSKEALLREIKDQLSAMEEESNAIAGSEVEALKQTIVDKDRKIAELSGELQTLQAQLQTVSEYPSEEEEEEEEVYRLMVKTSELRAKLMETEGEKEEGKRQLEAIHRQREHLQQLIADLREKKCTASQPDPQKSTATGRGLQLAETGQPTHFEVHLVDTAGDPCTTEQQITAELRSNVDGSITPTSVAHKTPDTYEVSYQPNTRGRHVLTVTVNGEPVQGSPFLVYVRQTPHLLGKPVGVIGGLHEPWMIATTGSGELVVSEENNKISFISRDGKRIRSINTTSIRSGIRRYKLNPTGIAIDEDSNIYVTDVESHRLSKFNSDGKLVKSVGGEGSRTGQFDCPQGIALRKDNKLFVCDTNNHRIQVFDTNLEFISCFGKEGSGEGEFRYPCDLTFDPADDVYVTDSSNDRVQVFSQNRTFLRTFGRRGSGLSELSVPWGICVDHDYVYVVDYRNRHVSVFYTSGEFITSFCSWGSGGRQLSHPHGITIDQDGFLYVCDTLNCHIQVF